MLKVVLISFLLFMGVENPKKGTLVVEIKGITTITGTVKVAVYNKADGFASEKSIFLGKVVNVKGATVLVELPDLPHGDYAIAAFHDKNDNGKLDKSLFGVPVENYGFSNNARGIFGPPNFNEAKFALNSSTHIIHLQLK